MAAALTMLYVAKTYELVRLEWLIVPPPEIVEGRWDDYYSMVVISWRPPTEFGDMVREYAIYQEPGAEGDPRRLEIDRVLAAGSGGFFHAPLCQALICKYGVVPVSWNGRFGRKSASVVCVADWCAVQDGSVGMDKFGFNCRGDSDRLCIQDRTSGSGSGDIVCIQGGSEVTCPFSSDLYSEKVRYDTEQSWLWRSNQYVYPGPD